jgi:SAM-dependent methyltransferase
VEPHETPAPEILMRWRDSCRDFLCHLYSYATLPHSTLDRLRDVLLEHKVNRVLELGAGTGYLAQLLNERVAGDGIFVEAVDLHPPAPSSLSAVSARNEYHGDTPPFYTITSGSESTILARRRSDMPRTALLLCYPPPDSSFAYDALRTFTECEGQLVVFVGEFKGLTGNANFERLLQSQYACVDRLPCLCWVTDASMVTVWERISPMPIGVPTALLLPCSSCGVAESIKRCRLLRCLSYCSRRCFDSHAAHRAVALELVTVKFGVGGGLDFNSNLHFAKLSSL